MENKIKHNIENFRVVAAFCSVANRRKELLSSIYFFTNSKNIHSSWFHNQKGKIPSAHFFPKSPLNRTLIGYLKPSALTIPNNVLIAEMAFSPITEYIFLRKCFLRATFLKSFEILKIFWSPNLLNSIVLKGIQGI